MSETTTRPYGAAVDWLTYRARELTDGMNSLDSQREALAAMRDTVAEIEDRIAQGERELREIDAALAALA